MKKRFFLLLLIVIPLFVQAQIPNFGTTVGDHNLYGYSSLKYQAKIHNWETYSTLQYGIGRFFQCGVDLSTNNGSSYLGYVVRSGIDISKYFKIGIQLTPSFDLAQNHKFSYTTSAVYINGDITKEGRLFYVTDLWLENNTNGMFTSSQWTYLGYRFNINQKGDRITPLIGAIHSWKFDKAVDLSMGCYFTHKNISLYAWANNILTEKPRFVLAIEFSFNN